MLAQTCIECSGPIECLGGNIVYPTAGYWKMDRTSDNIVKCFNNEACM